MFMGVLLVLCVCAWYTLRLEEGVKSPGTKIKDTCEPPCGCWDLNPGPLQVQQGFFLFWFGFLRLTVLLILYMCASEYVLLVYGFP